MAARGSGKAGGEGGKERGRGAEEGEGGEGEWWKEPLWQGAMIAGGAVVAAGLGVKYLMGRGEEGKAAHTGKGKAHVRRHVQALVVDPDMTVRVHKGDTLWGLAHKYQVPMDALRSANPDVVVAGDQVVAGSRLFIPNVISDEEFDMRSDGD
ncbi:hypothetical protein CLOM_g16600 [Closterium sp. NIES-68]|nr:hypothetical protein CLOM_g16600 [Closterium sp. NIES-68]GJP58816.1 hypothetical protein CLOP_g3665 [Closterium sp. NIES-67]GJP78032.1 hypothetical protein CLOP_g8362 [Closterium sp. NIES-67]